MGCWFGKGAQCHGLLIELKDPLIYSYVHWKWRNEQRCCIHLRWSCFQIVTCGGDERHGEAPPSPGPLGRRGGSPPEWFVITPFEQDWFRTSIKRGQWFNLKFYVPRVNSGKGVQRLRFDIVGWSWGLESEHGGQLSKINTNQRSKDIAWSINNGLTLIVSWCH